MPTGRRRWSISPAAQRRLRRASLAFAPDGSRDRFQSGAQPVEWRRAETTHEKRDGMKIPGDAFGRGCLWVSLAALYGLLAMRLFVVWRDGLWLYWPLGDFAPDVVVRRVFALADAEPRRIVVWLLRQDILYYVAAVCLAVWLLIPAGKAAPAGDKDESSR